MFVQVSWNLPQDIFSKAVSKDTILVQENIWIEFFKLKAQCIQST